MPVAEWKDVAVPVIGMLHAPPLPGSPRFAGDLATAVEEVLRDAKALAEGGVNGLMLENFGDSPFYPGRVPAETVAALTVLAAEVRRASAIPLGINVLRNDGQSALAIAMAVGASFIRVNILCGARVADQGLIQGIAHELLRDRARLSAQDIRIFADVDVKHSAPLARIAISDEVHDLVDRGGADALIVSGSATGRPISRDDLVAVKSAAGPVPVFLGSGVSADTLQSLVPPADGLIVGTSLKVDGKTTNPVDPQRVRRLIDAVRSLSPG